MADVQPQEPSPRLARDRRSRTGRRRQVGVGARLQPDRATAQQGQGGHQARGRVQFAVGTRQGGARGCFQAGGRRGVRTAEKVERRGRTSEVREQPDRRLCLGRWPVRDGGVGFHQGADGKRHQRHGRRDYLDPGQQRAGLRPGVRGVQGERAARRAALS